MNNTNNLSNKETIKLYAEIVNYGPVHRIIFFLISLIAPIIIVVGYFSIITGLPPSSVYFVFPGMAVILLPIWIIIVFPKHFKALREIGFGKFSKKPFVSLIATFIAFKPRSSEANYSGWMKLYYLALAGWGIFLVAFILGPILFINSR